LFHPRSTRHHSPIQVAVIEDIFGLMSLAVAAKQVFCLLVYLELFGPFVYLCREDENNFSHPH
jgi:hypothetical protein